MPYWSVGKGSAITQGRRPLRSLEGVVHARLGYPPQAVHKWLDFRHLQSADALAMAPTAVMSGICTLACSSWLTSLQSSGACLGRCCFRFDIHK